MSNLKSHTTSTLAHPSSSSSSSAASSVACAACKYQRRKCSSDCTLAPFFPADKQRQFLNVHRLFGVSNILKILKSVDQKLHKDTMNSIIFQSNIRAQDSIGGCYRIILDLQRDIEATRIELQYVLSQIAIIRSQFDSTDNIQPNLFLSPADDDVGAAMYSQQQQQHYYNNYFDYDVYQCLQNSHEQSNNGQNLDGGSDNNNNLINIGSKELSKEILLNLQQKVEGEDEVDVESLVDMSEMQHEFNINTELEDTYNIICNRSPVKALCSPKNEVKGETGHKKQVREHDLKSAASFFTLKNCNTSAS